MAVCSSIYKGQIGERKRASTSFFFFSRRKNETKMKSFTECSSVPEYQDRMANKKKKKKKEMCPGSQFESISFLASATVHLNQSGDSEPLWGIPISAAYNPLNETYFIFRRKGHTRHPSRWPQKLSWKYNVKKKNDSRGIFYASDHVSKNSLWRIFSGLFGTGSVVQAQFLKWI